MNTKTNDIVGQNLKAFRERMGLSQVGLAEYLGCTREEVSYFENGQRAMPSAKLTKAAELFGVDEYDLMEEADASLRAKMAFAFRADGIGTDELQAIASFKKVVMNYLNMNKALQHD